MRAKNVAQKLTRNLDVSASRDKLFVLIGLAELPGRAVECLGDLLGRNHSLPVRERLCRLNAKLTALAGKAYSFKSTELPNLENSRLLRVGAGYGSILDAFRRVEKIPPVGLD